MKYLIVTLIVISLIYCDVKKEDERNRRTKREQYTALLWDNTEAKVTVKVDQNTYGKYRIGEKYDNRTITDKFAENAGTRNAIYNFVTYRAEK